MPNKDGVEACREIMESPPPAASRREFGLPQAPAGASSRASPAPSARFLRWSHCRRPLRVVATVTCGASLWLSIAAYHEALHAGSTEPAAPTLRYPLLVRDAVDERSLRFRPLASFLCLRLGALDGPEALAVDGLAAHERTRRRRCALELPTVLEDE